MQLVEVTIDSLAEVGYVGTTLAEIARRAGVSPGLVAHYFDDKDGLLEAAFRTLARTLAARMRARLALARTPRGRVQAVIDINLAPLELLSGLFAEEGAALAVALCCRTGRAYCRHVCGHHLSRALVSRSRSGSRTEMVRAR